MGRILRAYLKERLWEICLYTGFMGAFAVIFYLYGIRTDAVRYAFLMSVMWILLYGIAGFIRYARHHQRLLEMERQLVSGLRSLEPPLSLAEEDYQRMVRSLYDEKMEMESRSRIARQEMVDYYGMWVHQIKTPIAAMRLLIQSREKEEGQLSVYTRELRMELFRIEQYVDMVLTYLRMEEMSSDLDFEECSLDPIIKQAVRKYSQVFILQKIRLNYEPVEKTVLTDEKWLTFVVEQLLSNALKYTKEGSISIYLEETGDGARAGSGEQYLVIKDTGIGIWPEDLPRVFEKGFTGYNGRKDKKSTGIGLYLCKSIMDKLQHGVWIESEPGQGTKVYLALDRRKINTE